MRKAQYSLKTTLAVEWSWLNPVVQRFWPGRTSLSLGRLRKRKIQAYLRRRRPSVPDLPAARRTVLRLLRGMVKLMAMMMLVKHAWYQYWFIMNRDV